MSGTNPTHASGQRSKSGKERMRRMVVAAASSASTRVGASARARSERSRRRRARRAGASRDITSCTPRSLAECGRARHRIKARPRGTAGRSSGVSNRLTRRGTGTKNVTRRVTIFVEMTWLTGLFDNSRRRPGRARATRSRRHLRPICRKRPTSNRHLRHFPQKRENPARAGFLKGWELERVARRAAGVAAGHAQRSEGGGVTVQLPPCLPLILEAHRVPRERFLESWTVRLRTGVPCARGRRLTRQLSADRESLASIRQRHDLKPVTARSDYADETSRRRRALAPAQTRWPQLAPN